MSVAVRSSPTPGADWDRFVLDSPEASLYHLRGWAEVAREDEKTAVLSAE